MAQEDSWEAMNLVPVEPSADIRNMASFCRQLYVALIEQGFSTLQAQQLVGQLIHGAAIATTDTDN